MGRARAFAAACRARAVAATARPRPRRTCDRTRDLLPTPPVSAELLAGPCRPAGPVDLPPVARKNSLQPTPRPRRLSARTDYRRTLATFIFAGCEARAEQADRGTMPRCYMVKKDPSPLEGTPPCSPTEASVAPPCYSPRSRPTLIESSPGECKTTPRHVGTQYEEPCGGAGPPDDTEPRNGIYTMLRAAEFTDPQLAHSAAESRSDYNSDSCKIEYSDSRQTEFDIRQVDYSDPRHAQYEPRCGDYAEPRTVRYLERDLTCTEPRAAEYAEPRKEGAVRTPARPGSPNVADGAHYAELSAHAPKRSAADTEAAHELLSLAAGVPPLPPAAVVTVLHEPVVPVYTYTLQPTSVYIFAEDQADSGLYAAAVQALTPVQQVEYTATAPVNATYITYQEPVVTQGVEYQQLYSVGQPQGAVVGAVETPLAVPVSVIEAVPAASPPAPLSVQVPVIEPVPHPRRKSRPAPRSPVSSSDSEAEDSPPLEKKNKYDCDECGKRYATSSNLSRHKQTHRSLDSQAARRCNECGKAYVSMPALAMHVLTHRMAHVCGVCGKQFSRPWLLRGHLRSHTGEKPYGCTSCGKSFADRSNLRAHLQTHSGDKKWECSRCNKTFALKSYLNKHQEAACSQDEQDAQ